MTPSEAPKALQASECSELLDPMRASCWISAQHSPGKFMQRNAERCTCWRGAAACWRWPPAHATPHVPAHGTCVGPKPAQSIAGMTWAIKLGRTWNRFQLASSAPPRCATDSADAPFRKEVHAKRERAHAMIHHVVCVGACTRGVLVEGQAHTLNRFHKLLVAARKLVTS